MLNCYKCNKEFEPDPGKVRRWAESDEDFDPTDWECPECATIDDVSVYDECPACPEFPECTGADAVTCRLCGVTILQCNAHGLMGPPAEYYCQDCSADLEASGY